MHSASPPLHAPEPPDAGQLAAWQAELASARTSPWLASLVMRRLAGIRGRLDALRLWLASLPRGMRRAWARRWALALPAAALAMALASWAALAKPDATITVGAGGCTLSAAITNANNNNTSGSASCTAGSGPSDTIGFANANGTYLLSTNYGGSPLPAITSPITIQGNGNTTLDAEFDFSVLRVTSGGSLGLSNATITGGLAASGGGIFVSGATLSVNSATIRGNTASDYGGGIFAEASSTVDLTDTTIGPSNTSFDHGGGIAARNSSVGLQGVTISSNLASGRGAGIYAYASTLSVSSTTISGNRSSENGGGIYANASSVGLTSTTISGNTSSYSGGGMFATSSTVNVTSATISGNSAENRGGGVLLESGTNSLQDSTISGNSAGGVGGGVYIHRDGTTTLRNTTISGNSASGGGAMWVSSGASVYLTHATITNNSTGSGAALMSVTQSLVGIQSSIVAGQAAGYDCATNGYGVLSSGGYNIEGGTSCGFTATGDLQNQAAQVNLDPLAPNPPGTTQTHALGTGSSALNHIPSGTNGCGMTITTDQRGVTRPQEGACDVGAYELEVATPTPPNTPVATPTTIAPTAARITHFAAAPDPTGRVLITWETASEVDVAGFRLQRAPEGSGAWADVGGLVPARGSSAGGARYTATDLPGVGSFAYRLEIVEAHGPPATHGPATAIVRALRAFLPVGWR